MSKWRGRCRAVRSCAERGPDAHSESPGLSQPGLAGHFRGRAEARRTLAYCAADDAGAAELASVAGAELAGAADGAAEVPLSAGAVVAGVCGVTAVPELSAGAIGVVVVLVKRVGS